MGRYALIIGTDEYADPKLTQLKTPLVDARAIADALADKNLGEFDDVLQCINQYEYEVRRVIAEFLSERKPDDLILIYFSGHGVQDTSGHLHLALKDTKPKILSATAIPSSFVTQQMDNCRSKKQILILDCCHSGAFAIGGTKAGDQKAVTKTTFEGEGYGRVVLTASDATQFALEGDQALEQTEFSLFTHFLLDGLKTGKADQDNDGFVSLDEWYEYTYSHVRSATPRQFPQKWTYRQQGDMRIAKNPHLKQRPVGVNQEILTLLGTHLLEARKLGVRELGNLYRSSDKEQANWAFATLKDLLKDNNRDLVDAVSEELKGLETTQSKPRGSLRIEGDNVEGILAVEVQSTEQIAKPASKENKTTKYKSVFVSYAWGGKGEEIVNQIDKDLQKRGIKIVRDKRNLGYKASIKEFMERPGEGNGIIVVISDKYLRSPNCMFEMVEIAENQQFHERVFLIVLEDANIYNPLKRIEYIKYWEIKRAELVEAMKKLDPANLQGLREEMDLYDRVRQEIAGLTSLLKDMNTLTPEFHQGSKFSSLYDAIEEKIRG
jgi:hypothetical protein